jgi:hypothetical protein
MVRSYTAKFTEKSPTTKNRIGLIALSVGRCHSLFIIFERDRVWNIRTVVLF